MSLIPVVDASFANEIGARGEMLRSQGGILISVGNVDALEKERTHIHPVSHEGTTLKRVVRATYQAVSYQMQRG